MYTVALELIIVAFNNLENRDAEVESSLGLFLSTETETAHRKIELYLSQLEPTRLYLGWNNLVYPQYKIKQHLAK